MIDWHTHVLPRMDDGSRSVEESVAMLAALAAEGVSDVVATPHFYANRESLDSFLSRREGAYTALFAALSASLPRVRLGAEVAYYGGISKLEGLERLAICGTRVLLLELPFTRWTDYMIQEVLALTRTRGLVVVLAHVERYLSFGNDRALAALCREGVLAQANAFAFGGVLRARPALRLLRTGCIQLLGSDAHNMTSRPPRLLPAYRRIERALGTDFAREMAAFGTRLLAKENR